MVAASTGAALKSLWRVLTLVGTRNLADLARQIPAYSDTVFRFGPDACAGLPGHLALTIDDGLCRSRDASLVREVRQLLRRHRATATFFVCAEYLPEEEAGLLLEDGHELGNHMLKDEGCWSMSPEDFEAALRVASAAVEALQAAPRWFRAPQGILTDSMRLAVQRCGMQHVLGDCYCDDWAIEDAEFIAETMLRQASSGSIAIFHMPEKGFREHTLEALRMFLEGLELRRLRCASLSRLDAAAAAAAPRRLRR
ncbi:unnamed protein product [Effrenium voratum]|nr:unnamed protein product [Effrenium voratum]